MRNGIAFALVVVAGCAPPWKIIRHGGAETALEATNVTFEVPADDEAKATFADTLAKALGTTFVTATVVELQPGEFNGFFNNSTKIRTHVTASGDEIELRCVVPADLYRPSASVRIAECARMTALYTTRYLQSRR